MPYTTTPHANHTLEIAAHLDAETVDTERETIVRALGRRVNIPGFRRGKAPLSLIRTRFASEIRGELEDHLSGMLWSEVLEGEADLRPVAEPRVNAVEFDDDGTFRLSAEVEVRPSLDLPAADGLELPEFSLDIAEAEIEAELEKIQKDQATWEPADDTPVVDGMLVEADLHGEMVDGDEDPYDEENARFVVGSDGVPAEVSEALQGARAGDERVAERRFPDDDANDKRAGKTVRYRIVVNGIKREALPDIDDALARALDFDSLEALTERIREAVERRKRGERRASWRRALLDQLEDTHDINDLPSSLVQHTVREEMNRFAYSMAMQGAAPASDEINWQELAARMEPGARRKVLDTLVLEQLAEEWDIEAPEHDVDEYITGEAASSGVPPAEHKANLAKEGKLGGIRHAVRISATVDELIRRAGGEVE